MVPAVHAPSNPTSLRLHGSLPARMKVLYVTTLHRTGGWLAEAFASDSASEVLLEEVIGVTSGLARLRDEVFDAVLISHEPDVLDALEMIEGLRAGGAEEPMIVLGALPEQEMDAISFEVGADGYCYTKETTTRSLIWMVARAIERSQLIRENRRMIQVERQRLQHEHEEAERLLDQQKSLVQDLVLICDRETEDVHGADLETTRETPTHVSSAAGGAASRRAIVVSLPGKLVEHYREMLRAYIIMGAGNLSDEMNTLAEHLALAGVTAQQAMLLHLHVLEELIGGLGNRSARHVMNRADLLVLEVMLHLAERYRTCYLDQIRPQRQLLLSGFDETTASVFLA